MEWQEAVCIQKGIVNEVMNCMIMELVFKSSKRTTTLGALCRGILFPQQRSFMNRERMFHTQTISVYWWWTDTYAHSCVSCISHITLSQWPSDICKIAVSFKLLGYYWRMQSLLRPYWSKDTYAELMQVRHCSRLCSWCVFLYTLCEMCLTKQCPPQRDLSHILFKS